MTRKPLLYSKAVITSFCEKRIKKLRKNNPDFTKEDRDFIEGSIHELENLIHRLA